MKEKVLVTYFVQYCKEIELEVNEEIKKLLDEGKVIDCNKYDHEYDILSSQEECFNLPIPNTNDLGNENQAEYVDDSFYIETFEKQL